VHGNGPATRRRPWRFLGLAVLVVVLLVGAGGSWLLWRHQHQGQDMSVPDDELLAVVDHTMQPVGASLWLRPQASPAAPETTVDQLPT
jgi:hypothetical protein